MECRRRLERLERERGELPEMRLFEQREYGTPDATIAAARAWREARGNRYTMVVVEEPDGQVSIQHLPPGKLELPE